MIRIPVALLALALFASFAVAEEQVESKEYAATGAWKSFDPKDRENPPPFEPVRREIRFDGEKPEGAGELPEGLADPKYGSFDMLGRTVSLVLAKGPEAAARDVLLLDSDGNGSFGEGEQHSVELSAQGPMTQGVVTQGLVLSSGGRSFGIVFVYAEGGERPLVGQSIALWYHEARIKAGEKEYDARFFDGDLDGRIGSDEDGWVLSETGAPRGRPANQFGVAALSGGIFLDGAIWRSEIGPEDSVKITARPADGPEPADLHAQRVRVEKLWFAIFDREREGFVKGRGLDTTRPLTEKPIDWKFVSFDEGLALAKKEGKPLFVDVLAFWCVWCYRMDYYTYPDREVAGLLDGKFIPVKIVEEQDPWGDTARVKEKLGARGIPAMGVWSPEGELLTKISGWNSPADFVKLLNEALAPPPK
ncbi:MAG: thioredoxin domain-containing protein [Planctomycetes bacterium]|jgi:hypothetical protein|nr:thioredoxin domain-containing protein [Planctomycetota bacterium]